MKLTEQEYEASIMTLAAGISGSIALKIKKQIKKFLPKDYLEDLLDEPDSEISIKFKVNFTIADVTHILKGIRVRLYEMPNLWRRNRYVLL